MHAFIRGATSLACRDDKSSPLIAATRIAVRNPPWWKVALAAMGCASVCSTPGRSAMAAMRDWLRRNVNRFSPWIVLARRAS